MNEQSFIRELQGALAGLPHEQREDILADYRSHFFEGKERGKGEEEIAKGLGEPRTIARAYLADYHFSAWRSPVPGQGVGKRVTHLMRAVFVTFSLLFFNFFFMLVPVILYTCFLFAAWVLAGALALVGIIFFVVAAIGGGGGIVLPTFGAQFALLFYALGSVAFSVLIAVGLYEISRLSVRGLLKYIRLNINLATA